MTRQIDDQAGPSGFTEKRYSAQNQLFHWASALLMTVVIILGWIIATGGPTPTMLPLWEWHKTLGLVVLLITVARIIWRWIDGPPSAPGHQPVWDRRLSHATYIALFAVMILMPVSGYLMSSAAGHPPKLFDVIQTPALIAPDKSLQNLAGAIHIIGQFFVYFLILLHLAGIVYHIAIVRDGMLDRMLPKQRPDRMVDEPLVGQVAE